MGHRERAPRLGPAPGMWAGLWDGVGFGMTRPACAAAAARPRLQILPTSLGRLEATCPRPRRWACPLPSCLRLGLHFRPCKRAMLL